MTTIMVVDIAIYVIMTGTTTMIMAIVLTKTMIMAMVETTTMNKYFQISSVRQFLLLAQNDKKVYENSMCTSSSKNRCFFHYSAY